MRADSPFEFERSLQYNRITGSRGPRTWKDLDKKEKIKNELDFQQAVKALDSRVRRYDIDTIDK